MSNLKRDTAQRITQHIRYGLTPLPFRTLPSALSYMLEPLGESQTANIVKRIKL